MMIVIGAGGDDGGGDDGDGDMDRIDDGCW